MIVETKRLIIRALSIDELTLLTNDIKQLETNLKIKYEAEPIEGFFKEIVLGQLDIMKNDSENYYWHTFWLIIDKSSSTCVGSIDFKSVPCNGIVEIGYGLGVDFVNKGYMSETVFSFCEWAFHHGVTKVIAETDNDNIKSHNVLKKTGFVKTTINQETSWWERKNELKKICVIGLSGESVFLSVDHMNKPEETIQATSRFTEPGGKGYNQAITIGKLGGNVSFITVLGNDYFKDECINVLKQNNVKPCIINKNIPSSYAVIITDKNANNNVICHVGASALVTTADIMAYQKEIDEAEIILLQLEYPLVVIKDICEYAHKNNKLVILNPAPITDSEILKEICQNVDIITPNEVEMNDVISKTRIVIQTLGNKGVLYKKLYPSYIVDAIDTTGAGDCFNGAFTYYLSKIDNLDMAIEFGVAASAIKVTRQGICKAIPSYDEVKELWIGGKKTI